MSGFQSLMLRADTIRRFEDDPEKSNWWAGYIRGLRRAHHGDRFGTEEEHDQWILFIDSDDPLRSALGRGYKSGLTLESHDPE